MPAFLVADILRNQTGAFIALSAFGSAGNDWFTLGQTYGCYGQVYGEDGNDSICSM